jgi:CRISPR-associated endonuclease/helicase Cas3
MNVLLISQCSKRALTETRRILDQFAERKGERTWQTAITMQGLETLRRNLRKTARRNTAVACHWIRGRNHSELMWIVGDASQFNAEGAVPTNITLRNVLRAEDENDWHTAELIRLIAFLAGLFHDIGKSSQGFQGKLKAKKVMADPLRHEWISIRILEAFVDGSSDEEWLQRLASIATHASNPSFTKSLLEKLQRDGLDSELTKPFVELKNSPLAQFIAWLILSHHRLPVQRDSANYFNPKVLGYLPNNLLPPWNSSRLDDFDNKIIEKCWGFPKSLPFCSVVWQKRAEWVAEQLSAHLKCFTDRFWVDNPFLIHLSRLCLMLADHYYSSLPPSNSMSSTDKNILYANTDRKTKQVKQRLDEHLIGVAKNAARVMRILPSLERYLPRIARHKGFKRRSFLPRFRWQDKAYDLALSLREKSSNQGFFGVNMASTGCGKTLANGRIMYGMSNPVKGARFTIALGLRVLTLQTGEAYRQKLELETDDLAVLVGESAVRKLYEIDRDLPAESKLQHHGSESLEELLPDNSYVRFEGSVEDSPLGRWLEDARGLKSLVHAPILISTIDHIVPATESTRGGHQIAPMLRLLTSDLVLDEPDDFGLEDLPALTRLVHWAGMLGSRVLLSSATLPPTLIQGLFNAYREGRRVFHLNRGLPGRLPDICCAWFDEHTSQAGEHGDVDSFMQTHRNFVEKRLKRLATAQVRRKAVIVDVTVSSQREEIVHQEFAHQVLPLAYELHAKHHRVDPHTGKKVSFGLVRMANIDPLFDVARELLETGAQEPYFVHLCPYHSQHPLVVRSTIERTLDRLLNRKEPDKVFEDPHFRTLLQSNNEPNQLFIVLGTAVTEIGRDHDYDWAIVEPSSMRSIIQLAGRVKRHRFEACHDPNIYLLNTNIKGLKGITPAFCRPGFEDHANQLESHSLGKILWPEDFERIDAAPRIRARVDLQPGKNLVDLEHHRLAAVMLGQPAGSDKPVTLWWEKPATLCGELQRVQPFRNDPEGRQRFFLQPDEEMEAVHFIRLDPDGNTIQQDCLFQSLELNPAPRIEVFGVPDYLEALESFSRVLNMEPLDCARLFGFVDLGNFGKENGWQYHRHIGMRRRR